MGLSEPLGPVLWREESVPEYPQMHRCNPIAWMLELFEIPWGVPWAFPFQPRWTGVFCGAKVPLQSSAEPQKAPDASLQAAEEELCVEVRASWGAVTALNQAILCSCQVDALTSHQGLLLKRGYAGFWCFLFFVFCFFSARIFPACAHPLPAARKEAPAEVSREVVF